jgi:hypothetical protein
VFAAAKVSVDYVRTKRKPYFLETYTYRQYGHLALDDQSYVDSDCLGRRATAAADTALTMTAPPQVTTMERCAPILIKVRVRLTTSAGQ